MLFNVIDTERKWIIFIDNFLESNKKKTNVKNQIIKNQTIKIPSEKLKLKN